MCVKHINQLLHYSYVKNVGYILLVIMIGQSLTMTFVIASAVFTLLSRLFDLKYLGYLQFTMVWLIIYCYTCCPTDTSTCILTPMRPTLLQILYNCVINSLKTDQYPYCQLYSSFISKIEQSSYFQLFSG